MKIFRAAVIVLFALGAPVWFAGCDGQPGEAVTMERPPELDPHQGGGSGNGQKPDGAEHDP